MENEGQLEVLSIGFYVGKEYFERYTEGDIYPQVAAFKLEGRFLEAIETSGAKIDVISTAAVSTFPKGKKILLPSIRFKERSMMVRVVPLLNLFFFKFVSRSLFILVDVVKLWKRYDFVIVYSVHLPNLIPAFIYSFICRVPFFVYIPDLPGLMADGDEWYGLRVLRSFNSFLCNYLITAASGLVVVTKPMATDNPRWKHIPYIVVEGIAESTDNQKEERYSIDKESKKIFLYAGGVSRRYGVYELVEGFLQADIDAELWICGRGDLETYLEDIVAGCSKIKYFGFLPMEEISKLQDIASCLVMTRNPKDRYTRYSFPSKVLEYMVSGKPVLTTFLEGIPEEYFRYFYEIKIFSINGISDAFLDFDSDCVGPLSKVGQAKSWVLANKTPQAVGGKIRKFLERCLV